MYFFYFKCFTDPGLLKIRELSTPRRCGLISLKTLNRKILETSPFLENNTPSPPPSPPVFPDCNILYSLVRAVGVGGSVRDTRL